MVEWHDDIKELYVSIVITVLESVSRVENKLCEEENKLLGFIMEIPYEAVKEMSSSEGAQVH